MNLRTLLAARVVNRCVIVCERAYPPLCPVDALAEKLRSSLYPTAGRVVVQTQRCANDWAAAFVPPDRICIIPNALPSPWLPCGILQNTFLPRRFLLAVGRLEPQKNFLGLIDAFAALAPDFEDTHLLILGEGAMRPELEARIAASNLAERIHLSGFVSDIAPYCRSAHAFVLSSSFEGFPNVLLEAMAEGCPPVAFDCPTGPAEIIRHEVDGLLVPPGDTEALREALARLLQNDALRDTLAQRAVDVRIRFAENAIMEQWNDCITRSY